MVVRLFGGNPLEQEKEMSEDEIRFYVAKNKKLPLEEKQMIEAVFDFGDQVVRQVMVPRTEIIHLQASDSIKDALEKLCRTGYQSFPVYRENYDDIIGMVKIQDLTCHLLAGQNLTLADITSPILFVPETKDTVELLKEFRAKKTSIAIVVDEYGGTAGLVTIEDLVDELIGDIIQDQDSVQKTSEGQWLVEGDTPIQTIVELLNIKTRVYTGPTWASSCGRRGRHL
jgi:putative hemolysin